MLRTILNWLSGESTQSFFFVSTDFEKFRYTGSKVKGEWMLRPEHRESFEKRAVVIRRKFQALKENHVRQYMLQLASIDKTHADTMDKLRQDYFTEASALCLEHRDSNIPFALGTPLLPAAGSAIGAGAQPMPAQRKPDLAAVKA